MSVVTETTVVPAQQGMSRSAILGYVGYALPITALPAAIVNLIPAYYAEVMGMSLATVGSVFFFLRMFDAITDPVMGLLVDQQPFQSQHRPWLLLSLPLFLISIALLFLPNPSKVSMLYLILGGMAIYSAYTIGLVAHQAWAAALATGPRDLSRLFGLREIAVIVGIFGAFFTPAVVEMLGHEALETKVHAAGGFLLVAFVVFTPLCLILVPDPDRFTETPKVSLAGVRRFLAQPSFLFLIVANLALNFAFVTLSVLSYFLAAYGFRQGGRYALAMSLYFVAAFVGMAVWMPMSRRLGDRKTLVVAALYVGLLLLGIPLAVARASMAVYFTYMVALGLGFGAGPYLLRSLVGRLANAHEKSTGEPVRGSAFALLTFLDKLGGGIASGTILPLIGWLGFRPGAENSAEVITSLVRVNTFAPAAAFLLLAILVALAPVERSALSAG